MNKQAALEWIVSNDTGISSKTMWYALMCDKHNRDNKSLGVPHDASDFIRCSHFAQRCELSESDLQRVAKVFPFWKPYIEDWSTLTHLLMERRYGELFLRLDKLENNSNEQQSK